MENSQKKGLGKGIKLILIGIVAAYDVYLMTQLMELILTDTSAEDAIRGFRTIAPIMCFPVCIAILIWVILMIIDCFKRKRTAKRFKE